MLTIAQVAVILQIREKLVRNHIKEKRLKAVKIGKYWRIKSEDFSDFIEGKTGNGMSESTVPSREIGDGPDLTLMQNPSDFLGQIQPPDLSFKKNHWLIGEDRDLSDSAFL